MRSMMRVLPDDLVAKCLAMLPQCDLQERCVCKRWRELRLSPAFRRYRRDGVERVLVATSWDDPEGGGTLAECFALIGGQWRKMTNNKVDVVGCAAAVTFRGELVIVGSMEKYGILEKDYLGTWLLSFEERRARAAYPEDESQREWPPGKDYNGVAFDLQKNRWRRLDWPLHESKHVFGAASNDDVIVILNGSHPDVCRTRQLRYHVRGSDEWLELPLPPHELGIRNTPYNSPMGMCIIGDVLYLAGGIASDDEPWPASTMLQALDLKTLEWTVLPPMPEPRVECLAVAANGRLFVLGGWSSYKYEKSDYDHEQKKFVAVHDALNSVCSFDPRTGTWRSEPDIPKLHSGRPIVNGSEFVAPWGEYMSAVAHMGSVCIFGIEGSPPLALADGVWTALPPLPEIDYMMQCGWPGHDNINLPSGYYHPRLASLPLEFFADDAAAPWPFRLASTLRGCAAPRRPAVFGRADSPDDDATRSDP